MTFAGRVEAFIKVPSSITASATNSGGGPTSVSLTAGTYTPTSLVAHVVARLNAVRTPANWTGSLDYTTGRVTLNCTGTWALSFTSTDLRDALGFAGNIASGAVAQTGTKQARGLWLPDCPLYMDGSPARGPVVSDLRTSEGPTGNQASLIGTWKYKHRGLVWSHVPLARTHEGATTTANASWECWFKDTQMGIGHAWFTPGSAVHIYTHDGILVGADLNAGAGPTNGWKLSGLNSIEPKRSNGAWDGLWKIEIPTITTSG